MRFTSSALATLTVLGAMMGAQAQVGSEVSSLFSSLTNAPSSVLSQVTGAPSSVFSEVTGAPSSLLSSVTGAPSSILNSLTSASGSATGTPSAGSRVEIGRGPLLGIGAALVGAFAGAAIVL